VGKTLWGRDRRGYRDIKTSHTYSIKLGFLVDKTDS